MRTASAIPYISLFWIQQTHTADLIFFSCIMNSTFQRPFSHCTFHISLFFNRSQSEAGVVNQMTHPCIRKKSVVGQLNVQTATAGKEK